MHWAKKRDKEKVLNIIRWIFNHLFLFVASPMGWKFYLIDSLMRSRAAVKKFERNIFIWLAALLNIKYLNLIYEQFFCILRWLLKNFVSSNVRRELCSLQLQCRRILANEFILIKRAPSTRSRSKTANSWTYTKRLHCKQRTYRPLFIQSHRGLTNN